MSFELSGIFGGKKIVPERPVALDEAEEVKQTPKGGKPREAQYATDEEARNFFRTPGAATGMDHTGSDFARKAVAQQKLVTGSESRLSVQDSVPSTAPSSISPDSLSSVPSTLSPDSGFLMEQQREKYKQLGKEIRQIEDEYAKVDAEKISPEQAQRWMAAKKRLDEIEKMKLEQRQLGEMILQTAKTINKGN